MLSGIFRLGPAYQTRPWLLFLALKLSSRVFVELPLIISTSAVFQLPLVLIFEVTSQSLVHINALQ